VIGKDVKVGVLQLSGKKLQGLANFLLILKVHKTENFDSDIEFCTISLLVLFKY